jgi:predicted DsbA family dithiol-disulfide isomerase
MSLKIEVYSDVICPWCYLGESRLKQAIASHPKGSEVEIHYLPYELNPATPAEGHDRKEYLQAKYGDRIKQADEKLKTFGKEAGIEYNFDKANRIPNTLKAHRLIWFADQKGVQAKAVNGLFKAYFTDGVDIGDTASLAKLAAEWGLDSGEVAKFLDSEKGQEEVRGLEETGYNLGVTGVPFFVFDGKAAVSGAQDVNTFTEIITDMTT